LEPDVLVSTYLRYRKDKSKDDRWALNELNELIESDAERGWEVTRMLVNMAASDEALAYVAAGPLENLLNKHGLAVIDRIEADSQQNNRMRIALSGAWIKPGTPVFDRWYALMRKYGFADGKRTAL
jgi:hypothetical protein